MQEPPRYVIHRLDFTGHVSVLAPSDWLCEFLPIDQKSAAVIATPRDWPFDRRNLGDAIKGWPKQPLQLAAIAYEIRAGKKATPYKHTFKARPGAPKVLCDGRRIYAQGGNLFLSYPLRAVTGRGTRAQRAIQFIN